MDVYRNMLRLRLFGLMCVFAWAFSAPMQGQEYVVERAVEEDVQAKWAIGWDLNRLVRGQAVASLERWFHPEFSAYVLGGAMVSQPLAPVLGTDIEWSDVEAGSSVGCGVRFHPSAPATSPVRGFVGFEINRDRYTFSESAGPNTWVHRELRALIGATYRLGHHVALTGHVAVNATADAYARRSYRPSGANMSIPGRVAGLQLAYRW